MRFIRIMPLVVFAVMSTLHQAEASQAEAAKSATHPAANKGDAKAPARTPIDIKKEQKQPPKIDVTAVIAKLVGDWESVKRSMGGLGVTFHFAADGSAAMSPGAMVDYTYTLTGNHLVMKMVNPSDASAAPEVADVHIDGDTMLQKSTSGGPDIKLVRLTPAVPGAPAIAGKWGRDPAAKVETEDDAPQLQSARETMARNYTNEYTADGKMRMRIPFITRKGTYKVDGDLLRLRYSDGGVTAVRYEFKEGKLFLSRRESRTLARMNSSR